jgi:hypothetical protein
VVNNCSTYNFVINSTPITKSFSRLIIHLIFMSPLVKLGDTIICNC